MYFKGVRAVSECPLSVSPHSGRRDTDLRRRYNPI
jgi:hypothetical protein